MTVSVYKDVLNKNQINELIDFFNIDDKFVDKRFDVRSKAPPWDSSWPNRPIVEKLSQILLPYQVEFLGFYESKISFKVHVDSGTDTDKLYKVILIPLSYNGLASTVFFDNYWFGERTKFSKTNQMDPFKYTLFDKQGRIVCVDDIRILLDKCINNPESVHDFTVDSQFISDLKNLIQKRHNADNRTSDYSNVLKYDPLGKFDKLFHKKYLNHIPIEDLHGLTVDQIYFWNVGDVVVFDRTQLHCAGVGHKIKLCLNLFLNLK